MIRFETRRARALLLLPFLLLAAPLRAAAAQDEGEGSEEGDEQAAEEDDAGAKWFAIVGGDVYTGDGGCLRGATILSKDGVIEEIGHDLYLPEGTEELDARGLRVYPGLVALNATQRLTGGLFGPADDGPRQSDGLHPDSMPGGFDAAGGSPRRTGALGHVEIGEEREYGQAVDGRSDIEDSFDPFSQYMVLALATGITCAEQSDAAVKLKRGEIEGVLMREKHMTPVTWSVSNPASIRSTKEKFAKADEYLRAYRAWEERGDKDEEEPSKRGVDSNALAILKGERLARFNADAREDLLGIARLAQRHRFRPVIYGCREGWTVAEELGRAGAFAVVTPRDTQPKDERLARPGGSSIENAAILHRSGVQVAVVPGNTSFDLGGITGHDLLHLPIEAAFAVRGGLPQQAALEALTIVPARLLGVEDRIGTLEPGKDCDAILTDGDVLHYRTFVQYAVVAGKLVYDKQEEIFFAHIRPRPERAPLDPGEEAPEESAPAGADDAGAGEDG